MVRVLIDTDVILDFFFDMQPFSEHAAEIFSLCERKEIKGFITPVILSNVYYLLRQGAKHEKIIEKLSGLISIVEILTIDKGVIKMALASAFKDFEDALQNYSAEMSGEIDLILTRNIKDYKNSLLSVYTPESYCELRSNR